MDGLHVRRRVLEDTFLKRKNQLEQCLALAILAADLKELEEILHSLRDMLNNSDQLGNAQNPHTYYNVTKITLLSGDSSSSAELLQFEHRKLLPEAQTLQERALKITKAHEQLVASGCYAGEPATEQAYSVLNSTSEYISDLQLRDSLLDRVIYFFKSAQNVTLSFNFLLNHSRSYYFRQSLNWTILKSN